MALPQIPVLDKEQATIFRSPPEPKDIQDPKRWTFSFRYWRQIQYFGLDHSDSGWFVSLLERLSALSGEEIERFLCDRGKINSWRYHQIDWGTKNIPIQLKDLDWLPSYFRDNPEEYTLVQFQISRALGRVVGFWDRNYIFYIVLLDPLHNIQPSKNHNYRVDPCNPLSCAYTHLLHSLDQILETKCNKKKCEYAEDIRKIPNGRDMLRESNVLMVKLTDEDIEYSMFLVKGGKTLGEIFRDGLAQNYNSE